MYYHEVCEVVKAATGRASERRADVGFMIRLFIRNSAVVGAVN